MRTTAYLIARAALFGGCKWTEFDDLEKETWVSTTPKPDGDSTDFGLALARGVLGSPSGGKLAAMGSSEIVYYELSFANNGALSVSSGQNITEATSVAGLTPQPIFLADPATSEVALILEGLGSRIDIWKGDTNLNVVTIFNAPAPDAATFMVAPPRSDLMTAQPSQPLVASGDMVYGGFYANTPVPQSKCQLTDDANTPVQIRALGAVKLSATGAMDPHDVVVWTGDGFLRLYSGAVFNGALAMGGICASEQQGPLAGSVAVDTGFQPGRSSQIIMIDDRYALLVGHKDIGTSAESLLALYDLRAGDPSFQPALVGNAIANDGLRTAAILDAGGQKYAVAGYPSAMIDGVNGGNVVAFPLDLTTGLDSTPAMTLHDAEPENNQQFGRAVAVTSFNGTPVIAVGADNEVFFYFRTALYDETRP